jgi:threonine synthase
VASNRNDILTRFLSSGTMTIGEVHPTLSPSMDIQVSSNLERLLFELVGRKGAYVADLMTRFRSDGTIAFDPEVMDQLAGVWTGERVDDDQTQATIASVHERTGVLIDPHTAVGVAAAERVDRNPDVPMVVLATAHPAKFPDAVEAATGVHPPLPDRLADLYQRPERYEVVPDDAGALEALVDQVLG